MKIKIRRFTRPADGSHVWGVMCPGCGLTDYRASWVNARVHANRHVLWCLLNDGGGHLECTCPTGNGSLRWPCPRHRIMGGAR